MTPEELERVRGIVRSVLEEFSAAAVRDALEAKGVRLYNVIAVADGVEVMRWNRVPMPPDTGTFTFLNLHVPASAWHDADILQIRFELAVGPPPAAPVPPKLGIGFPGDRSR